MEKLAVHAHPGIFGVAIVDVRCGRTFGVHKDRAFPLMSDMKAPIAAAVLARIDQGTIAMSQQVALQTADLVPGAAVPSIGDRLSSGPLSVSVSDLLRAAVSQSDNTAGDALLRLLGGPDQVTGFLQHAGIRGMHVRMGERESSRFFANLSDDAGSHPNAAGQEQETLSKGYRSFLRNPPNQTTPKAAVLFLNKLYSGTLISPASSRYLLELMYGQAAWRRLRGGLPPRVRLADKTGTGPCIGNRIAAWNDMGIFTWPDGSAVAVAAYLKDSTAPQTQRDGLFIELARLVTSHLY